VIVAAWLGELEALVFFLREKAGGIDVGRIKHAFVAYVDGALVVQVGVADEGFEIFGRAKRAVVPGKDHFIGSVFCAWKLEADLDIEAPTVVIGCIANAMDSDRISHRSGGEDGIEDVAAHVAEGAGAEIEPFAPFTWVVIAGDEWAFGGDSEPGVPIEAAGRHVDAGGAGVTVAPLLAAPAMDLTDFADGAFLDECDDGAVDHMGVDLDAHLGDKFFVSGQFGELSGLVNGLGEGFLGVDMQAPLHGGHGDGCVHVVGRGNVGAIEALFLVEKFAPILVTVDAWEAFLDFAKACGVDIGNGDQLEVFAGGEGVNVCQCHAAGAETGVAHGFARCGMAVGAENHGGGQGRKHALEG